MAETKFSLGQELSFLDGDGVSSGVVNGELIQAHGGVFVVPLWCEDRDTTLYVHDSNILGEVPNNG